MMGNSEGNLFFQNCRKKFDGCPWEKFPLPKKEYKKNSYNKRNELEK